MKSKLSHLDSNGNIKLVDISLKEVSRRIAKAKAVIKMKPSTLKAVCDSKIPKGNVLAASKIGGILAAKKVYELIPLCHQILIEDVSIDFKTNISKGIIEIISKVIVNAKTGAEMEALQACSQAALIIYDMCKAIDREIIIKDIRLSEKSGGKTGKWKRK